jgi:hypothetical protein
MINTLSIVDLALHPITANVMNHFSERFTDKTDINAAASAKFTLLLNFKMLERHPDLFQDHNFVMTSEECEIEGRTVQAKTLKISEQWELEPVDPMGKESADEARANNERAVCKLVDDAAAEIRADLGESRFCPYLPLVTDGIILDPDTLQPVARFESIYATL